jgi:murein DD-endopeptidase MepM/ murein hydrolase activator NlpD
VLLLGLLGSVRPAAAQELQLEVPVDCDFLTTCVVQNYVDHDAGPAADDYTCGDLTYNGHDGTDFRVPNLAYVFDRGVPVVAAAPGVVAGLRDGQADGAYVAGGAEAVANLECGNGVVLDHGGGWVTQYCHLRRDSVRVQRGQQVAAGEVLGLVGMSGMAEFPHLHLTVRHNNIPVDPFVGPGPIAACGMPRAPLWTASAQARLIYFESGLLNAGFTFSPPTSTEVLAGQRQDAVLPRDAPNLVFWTEIFGKRPGDRDRVRIVGPDGALLVDTAGEPAAKHLARNLTYSGLRRTQPQWRTGLYRGEYVLERSVNGAWVPVLRIERTVEIR